MKKTKFFAGALVLSMGLLGTGYAYWTDAISVNTTVSTGEMNVEYLIATEERVEAQGKEYLEDVDYEVMPSEDKKSLTFEVGNLYPGAVTGLHAKYMNNGTIGVKLDNVEVTLDRSVGDEILDNVTFYVAGNGDEYTAANFEKLEEVIKEEIGTDIIEPGQTPASDLSIFVRMNPETTGDVAENEILRFEVKLNWAQFNAPEAK